MELEADRLVILEMSIAGHSTAEIRDALQEKREYHISRSMVREDYDIIKLRLADKFMGVARVEIGLEMVRLDKMEREAWKMFRLSCGEGDVATETFDEIETVMSQEKEMVETTRESTRVLTRKLSQIQLGWFREIQKVQAERRKLLGMYAPKKLFVMEAQVETIHIKTIQGFNPHEEWPQPPIKVIENGKTS